LAIAFIHDNQSWIAVAFKEQTSIPFNNKYLYQGIKKSLQISLKASEAING